MHSQLNGSDLHIIAIGLIVAALCGFLASCIRFFFRDIAWKSVKAQHDQMGLESKHSAGWENKNAALGCIGILGSLLLAGVGIALIGNRPTPSPESMHGIINGTGMYPDAPLKPFAPHPKVLSPLAPLHHPASPEK
ncbi:MAG: hypothetical protein ABI210_13740 [Abditibacteriaceae bacterium]